MNKEESGRPSHLDVLDLAREGEELLHVLGGGREGYIGHLDCSDLKQRRHQTRSIKMASTRHSQELVLVQRKHMFNSK